ncbi:hypothetical protein HNQ54_003605 [Anaerocolumna cellulosilytica]|nr:hypothetical protein [Anaerocolumna cellulosilytica]
MTVLLRLKKLRIDFLLNLCYNDFNYRIGGLLRNGYFY